MAKKRVLKKRRDFLLGMGAFTLGSGLLHLRNQMQANGNKQRNFRVSGNAALRNRAAAKGLVYGAACHDLAPFSDAEFAECFARECTILVPESALKWKALRPSPNRFDFAQSDKLFQFARDRKMLFRGHPLIWHNALPKWFASIVNNRNAEQFLRKHITTVVGRYAGQVHSWDVVNEAIDPSNGRVDGLRQRPWLQFLGPDYIDLAFRVAAESDPNALLVYNDHNLDYDTPDNETRRTAVLRLLERLKSKGTPLHALGIQAHMLEDRSRFNPRKLSHFLRDVAELGLKILVTELDVADNYRYSDISVRDRIVAGIYEDYLSVVLDQPAVIAVLTWGLSDRYTWLAKVMPRKDRMPVRPLPLDAQLNRKLAWNAIARAFDNAPKR